MNNKKNKLTSKNFLAELKFVMDVLELKEDERILKILLNSFDPIAFIDGLVSLSGKNIDEVKKVLLKTPLKNKVFKYELLKDKWSKKGLDRKQSKNKFIEVLVNDKRIEFSKSSDKPQKLNNKNIHDKFVIEQFNSAKTTPFPYRDNMEEYVGRFFGLRKEKPLKYRKEKINEQEISDLEEDIQRLEDFLCGKAGLGMPIELNKLDNFIANGIGANEMYLQQLAQMVNELAENLKIKFRWEVVDNPADLDRVRSNCFNLNTDNTLVYDQSRSGSTTESGDFFEFTSKKHQGVFYANKHIIWANGDRFHKLGEELHGRDTDASVLHIDNTPENIGGRHMNLKTGMVYNPLFIALSILGHKVFEDKKVAFKWARKEVKNYAKGLFDGNQKLTPKNKNKNKAMYNPGSVLAVELLKKRDIEKRTKPAFVFDPSLKHFTTEVFQNTNEGIAKPSKGEERNNNMYSSWDTSNRKLDYLSVFKSRKELYYPLFIINENSRHARRMRREARALAKIGVPVQIVRLNLKKLGKITSINLLKDNIFSYNLRTQAHATALLQTHVTTFTHLTDQDANSNPAVKMTRTITGAIQNIIVDRKISGKINKSVTLADILEKMKSEKKKVVSIAEEKISLRIKEVKKTGVSKSKKFNNFDNKFFKQVTSKLKVKNDELTALFVGSISRVIFSADFGEAGGIKNSVVDAMFKNVIFDDFMSSVTKDFELEPLPLQINAVRDKDLAVSFACPKSISKKDRKRYGVKRIEIAIANYYEDLFLKDDRYKTLNTIGVGFSSADREDENIIKIMRAINGNLKQHGINFLDMYFPRVAHTGIEAAQALPEILAIVGLVPYQNIKEKGIGAYGGVVIREGLTVNDANKIYTLSNVARMALGGSPTVIFEYKNAKSLPKISKIMVEALKILAKRLENIHAS